MGDRGSRNDRAGISLLVRNISRNLRYVPRLRLAALDCSLVLLTVGSQVAFSAPAA